MNTRCSLLIVIAVNAVALTLLSFALNAQDVHAITRAEILEGYKVELKPAHNDPSLNPAATALCQLIARRLHPSLPDTSQLDYDLDEKQNQYFEKIAIQLDLDKKTRGLVAWRIFKDACKVEVGNFHEPSRWNRWRHDSWSKVMTQQEQVERDKERARLKAKEAREKAESAQREAKREAEYQARQERCSADLARRKAQYFARSKQCDNMKSSTEEANACDSEVRERFLGRNAKQKDCYR